MKKQGSYFPVLVKFRELVKMMRGEVFFVGTFHPRWPARKLRAKISDECFWTTDVVVLPLIVPILVFAAKAIYGRV